jgi:hypothetical protein
VKNSRFTKLADIEDLKELSDPLSKVTGGLIGSKKSTKIPLQGVHIRAKVIDMVAKVSYLKTIKFSTSISRFLLQFNVYIKEC